MLWHAALLGALDSAETPSDFRMADASQVGVAIEHALGWPDGSFVEAMKENAVDQVEEALESNPLAQEIIQWTANGVSSWTGPAADLMDLLNRRVTPDMRRARGWPVDAARLSGALGRVAPALRAVGIEVIRGDRESGTGRRLITITATKAPPPTSDGVEEGDAV